MQLEFVTAPQFNSRFGERGWVRSAGPPQVEMSCRLVLSGRAAADRDGTAAFRVKMGIDRANVDWTIYRFIKPAV